MQIASKPGLSSRIVGSSTPIAGPAQTDRTKLAHYPPVSAVLSGHPLANNPLASDDKAAKRAHSSLKILIAEDNYANQLIAKTLLMRAGHKVSTVDHGDAAIHACAKQPFDLILMDIEMPVRNGIEATEHIRRSAGPNQKSLIIALTAFGSAAEKYTYRQSGIDAVLTKPLRMDQLNAALAQHFPQHVASATPPVQAALAPASEDAPMLDMDTLYALLAAAGIDGLTPILKAYWRSAYALLADMQDAHQIWDRARLNKSAHALKGASVNIGLPAIGRIAASLQNAQEDTTPDALDALDMVMTKSRKALARYLKSAA